MTLLISIKRGQVHSALATPSEYVCRVTSIEKVCYKQIARKKMSTPAAVFDIDKGVCLMSHHAPYLTSYNPTPAPMSKL